MKWKCSNPRGATGTVYQIWRQIGVTGELEYMGGVGEKKYTDSTVPPGTAAGAVSDPGGAIDLGGPVRTVHRQLRRRQHVGGRRDTVEDRGVSNESGFGIRVSVIG